MKVKITVFVILLLFLLTVILVLIIRVNNSNPRPIRDSSAISDINVGKVPMSEEDIQDRANEENSILSMGFENAQTYFEEKSTPFFGNCLKFPKSAVVPSEEEIENLDTEPAAMQTALNMTKMFNDYFYNAHSSENISFKMTTTLKISEDEYCFLGFYEQDGKRYIYYQDAGDSQIKENIIN